MLNLPKNSLGHELAVVMKAGNFDPNYFRRKNPNVEGKVILDHIEQTHDIWHIVTGFTDLRLLPPIMDTIVRGWKLSKSWPPLFAVHWSEIMHLSVEDIRSQLDRGIIPHVVFPHPNTRNFSINTHT